MILKQYTNNNTSINNIFIAMRKSIAVKILFIVGFILIIAGIIFVAQSNSMIGPQSSFMYSNPQ
jgi:hypothetical protein